MHCAQCGYMQPGEADACPLCGKRIVRAASFARAEAHSGAVRLIVYSLLAFGVIRVGSLFWGRYIDAEQERVESLLMNQSLAHKRQILEAERAIDGF